MPETTTKTGFRPSKGQVGAGVLGVLLVAFVLTNAESAEIHLLVTTVSAPLWLVLAVVIIVAFAAGFLVGRQRGSRK